MSRSQEPLSADPNRGKASDPARISPHWIHTGSTMRRYYSAADPSLDSARGLKLRHFGNAMGACMSYLRDIHPVHSGSNRPMPAGTVGKKSRPDARPGTLEKTVPTSQMFISCARNVSNYKPRFPREPRVRRPCFRSSVSTFDSLVDAHLQIVTPPRPSEEAENASIFQISINDCPEAVVPGILLLI